MNAFDETPVPGDTRRAAAFYLDLGLGLAPIPVPRRGRRKAPALGGWQALRPSHEDLDRLFPDAGARGTSAC